jgi:hypothetical protein
MTDGCERCSRSRRRPGLHHSAMSVGEVYKLVFMLDPPQLKNHPMLGNINVGSPTKLFADSFELHIRSTGACPVGKPVIGQSQSGVLRV